MSRSIAHRKPRVRKPRRAKTRRRPWFSFAWPGARRRSRWLRAFLAAPIGVKAGLGVVVLIGLWSAVNWGYQVVRKPTELYFPVSSALDKTPVETWRRYAPIFRLHSTAIMTPELLAALAQVEGAGNPVARTYWRWSLAANPFEVYRPASSAVGMYQITDTTFALAKRYCVHDHVVVEDGPWYAWRSCWFNGLYTRVIPTHAVELTAALLDHQVRAVLSRQRADATPEQEQDLAAVIHLCGAGAGATFVRRDFRPAPGERCGEHDVRAYLGKVNAMKRLFGRLAAAAAQTD
jgi:hypothetical protein